MSRGTVVALRGWERHRLTWCRTERGRSAEVSRQRNPDGGLIEWHALVWEGRERGAPLLDEYTGQDVAEATALAAEALGVRG